MTKKSLRPPARREGTKSGEAADVRERILATASDLFYREGARAVGVDLIVERAGVAKTSLYRHFPSKDDLIEAFLEREDEDFWRKWDLVASAHQDDAGAELEAQLAWIEERVTRPNYRGCPQINIAAEFSDPKHPARTVAIAHKTELKRRLTVILEKMGADRADELGTQMTLVINGAFTSSALLEKGKSDTILRKMAAALIKGAKDEQ